MAAAIIILIGCVKDPAKLGIHPNTLYKGRVIEKSQNKPIKGVTVSVTDGSHVHTSQVTGDDGRFEFRVDFDAIDDNYSLQLDCQGYTSLKEDLKGFGQESYDYKDIVYYDNSNPSNWPNVTTKEVSEITSTTARTGGTITYSGAAEITARGVCWGTTHTPDIDGNHTTDGSGTGSFTSNLTNLSLNTTYFVRAYATNMHGTYYGEEKTFTTNDGSVVVTTNNVTNVTPTSATCGGTVTVSSGNTFPITSRGVCWATTHNPTIDNAHTSDGSGVGSFTSSITGLTVNTNYYVRAYATNEIGTFYGEEKNFNTTMGLATVTTKDITDIYPLSATGGGIVTVDNGFTVTSRGICWSVVQNPTIDDSHTTNGSGTGEFNSLMDNLQNSTTYHIRAYATNANGTAYGEDKIFTTTSGEITVTTNSVTDVTASSATCGGNATITNDNNLPITAKGVCWSTSHNPSINDNHSNDGSGTGTFTSTISGLSVNTQYYVRAYATNQLGTYYGSEKFFTTTDGLPVVSLDVNSFDIVSATSVSCISNVSSDGGLAVIQKGVCWATVPNPTIANNHTNEGGGIGYYTSILTNLDENSTYYVRSYATNSAGTGYSEQFVLTAEYREYLNLPRINYDGYTYVIYPDLGVLDWNSAYNACDNLSFAGFSDWFMPNKDELYMMYMHKDDIGGFVTEEPQQWPYNQFPFYYWSSTIYNNDNYKRWYINFVNGQASGASISSWTYVGHVYFNMFGTRPVRKSSNKNNKQ